MGTYPEVVCDGEVAQDTIILIAMARKLDRGPAHGGYGGRTSKSLLKTPHRRKIRRFHFGEHFRMGAYPEVSDPRRADAIVAQMGAVARPSGTLNVAIGTFASAMRAWVPLRAAMSPPIAVRKPPPARPADRRSTG